jgi:peptidoglycan/LPS O-acetylase OafA/YrhL
MGPRWPGKSFLITVTRIATLDGLRAISILLVLVAHWLWPLGPKPLRLEETAGVMGMSLFFALSGFLIASNLLNGQRVRDFFVRRLARILPLSYAYLALVFLIITLDPLRFVGNLAFVANYVQWLMGDYVGHFWSLCVEVHFYLAIGLAVLCFGTRGILLVVPACFIVTGLRIYKGAYISLATHLRIDEILAGAIVAILHHRGALNLKTTQWLVLAVAAGWLVASSPLCGWLQYARPYFSAAVLAVSIGLVPSLLRSALTSRPARWVAEVSYALYVIHPITSHGWMNEGSLLERFLIKRPVSFALTSLIAHISTFYYERFWIALGKKLPPSPIPLASGR